MVGIGVESQQYFCSLWKMMDIHLEIAKKVSCCLWKMGGICVE
jgi:hypothetical protein